LKEEEDAKKKKNQELASPKKGESKSPEKETETP
jgi:hypothetical protein